MFNPLLYIAVLCCLSGHITLLKFVFIYFKFFAYILKVVYTQMIFGSSVTFTLTSHMLLVRSFRGQVISTENEAIFQTSASALRRTMKVLTSYSEVMKF